MQVACGTRLALFPPPHSLNSSLSRLRYFFSFPVSASLRLRLFFLFLIARARVGRSGYIQLSRPARIPVSSDGSLYHQFAHTWASVQRDLLPISRSRFSINPPASVAQNFFALSPSLKYARKRNRIHSLNAATGIRD